MSDLAIRAGVKRRAVYAAQTRREVTRFACIGVVSSAVHLGSFALFSALTDVTQAANFTGLVVATMVSTALNRRWTFGISGRQYLVTHHLQALLVFGLALVLSVAGLELARAVDDGASTASQVLGIFAGGVVATVIRFLAMRYWIFRRR